VNGWSSKEPKINEDNKALVRTWIDTINRRDKKKKLGVQKAWIEGKEKKKKPWPRENKKNDGQGKIERAAKERKNFNKGERKRKQWLEREKELWKRGEREHTPKCVIIERRKRASRPGGEIKIF
jgi:hypothetical protein